MNIFKKTEIISKNGMTQRIETSIDDIKSFSNIDALTILGIKKEDNKQTGCFYPDKPKPTPKPEHGEPIEDNKICIAGLHNTKYCKMEACHFKESCNIYSHDKTKTETQKSIDQTKENLKLISDLEKRVDVLEKKYQKPESKQDRTPDNFKNCFGRFHDWDSDMCILCSYKKTCSSTCIDNNARIKVMFKKHEFKTETPPDVKYLDNKEKKPVCFGSKTCENQYKLGAACTCVSHCFEYSRRNERNKPKCFGCESPVAECSSRCVHFEECNAKYNNLKYSSISIVFYSDADQEEVQKLYRMLKNSKLVQGTGIVRK